MGVCMYVCGGGGGGGQKKIKSLHEAKLVDLKSTDQV